MRKAELGGAQAPIPQRYVDEAARPDAEAIVRDRLPAKLLKVAGDNRLVSLVREAYGYVSDPRVPNRYKVLAVAALLYFISPFDAIPDFVKTQLYRRLYEILTNRDTSSAFARIPAADRTAMFEILQATKPDLPSYWETPRAQ